LTCKNETDLIGGYITSNLPRGVAAAFEAHMDQCSDCAAFLKTYKKTIEATRAFLSRQTADHRPKKFTFPPSDAKRPAR
jgi:anti-sigma factor RsiW